MTLIPIKGAPTDATVTAAPVDSAAPGSTTAADFLAAILQALAPATDPAAAPVGPEAPATDPAALGLVVPPGLAAQLVPVPSPVGTGEPVASVDGADGAGLAVPAVPVAPVAPAHANVAGGTEGAPTRTTGDIRMSGDALPSAAPTTRGTEDAPAPERADAGPTTPGLDAVGSAAATARAGTDPDGSMPDPSSAPAPTAPISAASTAPALSRTEAATTAAPQHVTRQVFPEVTRLVSRGDGTHRITLDLNPESLGEVRVVMTVRDGAVHVRFAAGHEAGRALLDGSAELNRLLGAAGASETRIVVRELAATAQPTATTADGTSTGSDPGFGPGGHRPQDQHAGTRAEHHATDGSDTTTPGNPGRGANAPRSTQPVTRTRTAGVDVTM